ncbi:MAG: hypothetical protein IPM33_09950 [Phycisphaerales bacterium]|nr:hypothetical protein [Phycisphaerales bacterium]
MDQQPPLIVRRNARHDVAIRGRVSIAPDHAKSVSLAGASGAKDGWVDVDIVDFSTGGVGMVSLVFLPRKTHVRVQVFGPDPESPALVELPGVVQRVCMTDRRPAYLIGASVGELTPEVRSRVESILAMFADASPTSGAD